MGVREGLLALLDAAPTHGYRLRAELEETVGALWSVNVGQVYTTLQRLERDGLVVADGEADDSGRHAYALSPAGREDVRAWLVAPILPDVASRDELVLKVLLARRTGLVETHAVLDAQRASTMAAVQQLTRDRAGATALEVVLALDRQVLLARAELEWLDLVEERLAAAPADDG